VLLDKALAILYQEREAKEEESNDDQ